MKTNTAPAAAKLTWTRPELLADAGAWMAKDNAVELVELRGQPLTNATLRSVCEEAVAFFADSIGSRKWCNAYRTVLLALA